jgi:two-component system cell cycle sensor histidine kinase/response regulator CckA
MPNSEPVPESQGLGMSGCTSDFADACRELFEHAVVPIVVTRAGVVVGANQGVLDLYGYGSGEIINRSVNDFIHPDDHEITRRQAVERAPGVVQVYPLKMVHRDGHVIEVEVTAWGSSIGGRETVMMLVRDLSEQRKAQAELSRTSSIVAALMRASPDMVYLKDRDGKYLSVNRAFENTVGRHHKDVIGLRDEDVLPPEYAKRLAETDRLVLESRSPISYTATFEDPQGKTRTFETVKAPVFGEEGDVLGLVGVNRDVTEREHLREDLSLAERTMAIGMLARGIAHEYNNILTSLQGLLGFASQPDAKEKEIREDAAQAKKLVERAADLTQQIVALSEGPPPHRRPCRIEQIAHSTLGLIKEMFKKDGIEVVEKYDVGVPTVAVDRAQVAQVLLSLLINAREAVSGRTEKRITVSVSRRGTRACLSVEDTGRGIPPENLRTVFQSPVRSADAGNPRSATGLGLSVVERIVRNHGGEVEVSSSLDVGTTIQLLLPVERSERGQTVDASVLRNKRVLVVEDEQATRALSVRALNAADVKTQEAGDAPQAIAILRKERFDAVLLDLVLPQSSGEDVLEAVGKIPLSRRPVVVVFTGLIDQDGCKRLIENGAARILYKPHVTPQELVFELADVLTQHGKK